MRYVLTLLFFISSYSYSVIDRVDVFVKCPNNGQPCIDTPNPNPPSSLAPQSGRSVQNTFPYKVAVPVAAPPTFPVGNDDLTPDVASNWTIVSETNGTVTPSGGNLVFARNVLNDNSNMRAYAEFDYGPIWPDQNLSVCMNVSNFNEDSTGTANVGLQVSGSVADIGLGALTRTPSANGDWCTVLDVTAHADTVTIRLGIGVTGNDTRTNGYTVSQVRVGPTFDDLPNEYTIANMQGATDGNSGANGASFNFDKVVSYDVATGQTAFTIPSSPNTDPSASIVLFFVDSYGAFINASLSRELFSGSQGRSVNNPYSMLIDSVAGRQLDETDPVNGTTGFNGRINDLPDLLALNVTPNAADPYICVIAQGSNDFIVGNQTSADTLVHLQSHLDWCTDRGMVAVTITTIPFGNAAEWTQAKQDQIDIYNPAVRSLVAGNPDYYLVDYNDILDTDDDNAIDAGFDVGDGVHPNQAGYTAIGTAFDAIFKQIRDDLETPISAAITPSRTSCVSPCPVVFSAENTTADGMDDSAVWSQLGYYWDFDTDETDTYGSLYSQTYTAWSDPGAGTVSVGGDTAREVGHVPLVTKTFLCETGTCTYNVGLRAQNAAGVFDDAFTTITVNSESAEFSLANTICVSNTLSTGADWTVYDKPCPSGATKQSSIPDADQFTNKLILLRKGDSWTGELLTMFGQDNFKVGYFGNNADAKPYFSNGIFHNASYRNLSDFTNPSTASAWSFARNSDVTTYGWPENNTYDGLAVQTISIGMSFQHVTMHDLDLDRDAEVPVSGQGGSISWSRGHLYCHDFPSDGADALSCSNVPYPKGIYLSSSRFVGDNGNIDGIGIDFDERPNNTLNVGSIGCGMVNFAGITDSYFRKAFEHNLRVMGWYRFSIMRNVWAGEHYKSSKQKISTRVCAGGPNWPDWDTWKTATYDSDPEGRTRADQDRGNGTNSFNSGDYVHTSRFQVTNGNRVGVAGNEGTFVGGPKVQTNIGQGDDSERLVFDIIYNKNTFENDIGSNTTDINSPGTDVTCVDNIYPDGQSCILSSNPVYNARVEPTPVTGVNQPGT